MLGFMPGASTLLTCLLTFSTLGALAAPTPPGGSRSPSPPPGGSGPQDVSIGEKQQIMKYAHYSGAVYCPPKDVGQDLGGKKPDFT
jgi:hypothetical protein